MPNRVAILFLCALAFLVGPAASARADSSTQLPFSNSNSAWLAVDPSGSHVFVSGGPGTSSIVVLNYAGTIIKTITGEGGASQMAVDTATHTLYVALHDQTAISEINTQTLTETTRFSTSPYPDPMSLAIAGGKLWFSCQQDDGEGCHGLVSADLNGSNMAVAGAPVANWYYATALTAGGLDNKYLAAADSSVSPPDIDVYDVSGATPTLVSHVHATSSDVADMTFDPSGANLLLACGYPYYVESLATSTLLSSAQYPTGPYPISVAVTANGKFVAGGIDGGSADVFVYPVNSTTPVRTFQLGDGSGNGKAHSLAFNPDASKLFAVTPAATGDLAFHVLDKPTIPLKPSTTSMKSSSRTVRYGSHTSLKVTLTGPTGGKVDLYATTSEQTKQLVATHIAVSGTATFTITPTENTTYSAQFEQGSGFASSTSGDLHVAVSPIVSVAIRPGGKVRYHGRKATKTWLTGKVIPRRPANAPIDYVIQLHVHRSWTSVFAHRFIILSSGLAPVYFVTNHAGLYRVRVSYPGDTDYASGRTGWKTFYVRR